MSRFAHLVCAGLLAGVAVSGVQPALAQPRPALSGECFWRHLERPTRAALLQGYQQLGPDVLDRVFISDDEHRAIDEACQAARGADPSTKQRLLAAIVVEHGAAVFLKGRLRWQDEDIQAAWRRLDPEARSRLRREADAALGPRAPGPDDIEGLAEVFLGPAAQDTSALDQAKAYLTSRAVREAIERGS